MKKFPINILNSMQNQNWFILPQALQTMLDIVYRDNSEIKLEALLAREGEPLENTRKTIIRDGVAILPVSGPIFPKANLFTEISGATSLEVLAQDFLEALNNEEVTSIIFDVDSPGGSVTGLSDFSDLVYNSRGKKPIISFISGTGASASYFIASASDKVIAPKDAIIGAIGTIVNITDSSENDKKAGIKEIRFTSAISPKKNLPISSKEGGEQIQALVNELGEVFVSAVARNRGVTFEKVTEDFGKGGVLVGESALKAGMIDSIGSLEGTIEKLKTGTLNNQVNLNTIGVNNIMKPEEIKSLTLAEIEAHNSGLATEIKASVDSSSQIAEARQEGIAEGIKKENERIQAIEGIKNPTNEALVDSLKFNSEMDKGSVALEILKAQNKKAEVQGEAILQDATDLTNEAEALENSSSEEVEETQKKVSVSNMVQGANDSRKRKFSSLEKLNLIKEN